MLKPWRFDEKLVYSSLASKYIYTYNLEKNLSQYGCEFVKYEQKV